MRLRLVLLGLLAAPLGVVFASSPAGAAISGPCRGTLNGIDVGPLSTSDPDAAIKVGKDDEIVVTASSSASIDSYQIELEYAGIRWTVADGDVNSTSWTKNVRVSDYTRWGVGLYRVHAKSTGSAPCEGSVLVKVGGSPLTTAAGLVGLGLVGIGVGNAAFTGVRAARATGQRGAQ